MTTEMASTALVSQGVPSHDIFIQHVIKNLDIVMKKLRPSKADKTWTLLQTLYTDNPSRFIIISSIHQNSETDRLHYSVAINLNWACWTLHVYGYWKNFFNTTDITIAENDGVITGCVSFVKTE
jgi:hypothetical protein